METALRTICLETIQRLNLKTIEDLVEEMPKRMHHISQEPKRFRAEGDRFAMIKKIKAIDLKEYLRLDKDLSCLCSEMALAAACLGAVMLEQPVYVIGKTSPAYMQMTNRYAHYFNALAAGERIRFFDTSVYVHMLFHGTRVPQEEYVKLGFVPADINFEKFIGSDYLQKKPQLREIKLVGGVLEHGYVPGRENKTYFLEIRP